MTADMRDVRQYNIQKQHGILKTLRTLKSKKQDKKGLPVNQQ